jgi:SEC-C motif-containing protein
MGVMVDELAPDARCPCGTGDTYGACCGRFHDGSAEPPTAETLMRSRYSAFATGNADYLLKTWHSRTRPPVLDLPSQERRWLLLEITGCVRGGLLDSEGSVAFRAHYREAGSRGSQQENSRFRREGSRWRYLDARGDEVR